MNHSRIVKHRPTRFDANQLPADWFPLVRQIYASRLATPQEYDKQLAALAPPHAMAGLSDAVQRLRYALDHEQSILIYGDYDVDGACATALMVRVLRALGAHVQWFIPNRCEHGYGLSIAGLSTLNTLPDLVITVDNGIQSFAAAQWLNERQVDLIITDHHIPSAQLPQAYAVIDPQRRDCGFSDRNLCGAGVAFYLLLALRRQLLNDKLWPAELNITDYLDLVATATIADLVPLSQNNRILVHAGLKHMCARKANPGLLALAAVANIDARYLNAQDIAFAIAPRLNAVGRLGDMRDGVALLLSDDWQTAHDYAANFDELNRARKTLEGDIVHSALAQIDDDSAIASAYSSDWHEGVIGIVAGRIKAKTHRPTLIATDSNTPLWRKASLRSVEGINIKSLLDSAASKLADDVLQYGGHAMAAGLSIRADAYPQLIAALEEAYRQHITELPTQYCYIDGILTPDLLNVNWAKWLEQLEPWGQQLPQPMFCNVFDVLDCRHLGASHTRITLREPESGQNVQAMWFFNHIDYPIGSRVRVVYSLQVSRFHGDERLNLIIEHIDQGDLSAIMSSSNESSVV